MKKQYITNKAGERIFPYTHLKAVLDDNGNPLDSLLNSILDLIGQGGSSITYDVVDVV